MQLFLAKRRGITLIEALIAIALLVIFSSGIYLGFQTVLNVTRNSQDRAIAAGLLSERAEFIRNLPYASIGLVSGVPAGILQSTEQFVRNGLSFTIQNYIRNIDDPFDGVISGTPNDLSPADYKLVELRAACTSCKNQSETVFTFRVAPKGLESSSNNGSLFVNVFDGIGAPISGVNVTVVNNQASPTISIADVTNLNGVLQIVDAPTATGTNAYQITVGKSGYSSDRTYTPGLPANPNPKKADANVDLQKLTDMYFQIDKLGTLTLNSSTNRCVPVPNSIANLVGAKLIGTNPDIIKYASTSITDASGTIAMPLEWDTYLFSLADPAHYLAGVIPYGNSITINPSAALARQIIVSPQVPGAVLVDIVDTLTGAPLSDATATLEGGAVDKSLSVGYANASDTTWLGNYVTHDGFMDTDSAPGYLMLLISGGVYPTSTWHWLISNTIDFGAPDVSLTALDFVLASLPAQTGVKFQLAVNNDNATWNFVGSDGTAGTFFTSTTTLSGFANNRYLRYKVFFETDDEAATPQLDSITFTFKGGCVPASQILFTGLPSNNYTLTVNSPGYQQYQSALVVGQSFQGILAQLQPL